MDYRHPSGERTENVVCSSVAAKGPESGAEEAGARELGGGALLAPTDLRASQLDEELLVLSYELPVPGFPDSLTNAEQEVLIGVLEGKSNELIARERGRDARTVANQLSSAFKKLGVHSRFDLVRLVASRQSG